MSDPFPSRREFARMHEMHYDEDRHRGDDMDEIPMDPFHTLVMRGWGVEIVPTFPSYVDTLGTHSLMIRRYDHSGNSVRVSRSFHLYGDDADDLLRRAADIALRIEQGRPTGVPTETFIKGTWL